MGYFRYCHGSNPQIGGIAYQVNRTVQTLRYAITGRAQKYGLDLCQDQGDKY